MVVYWLLSSHNEEYSFWFTRFKSHYLKLGIFSSTVSVKKRLRLALTTHWISHQVRCDYVEQNIFRLSRWYWKYLYNWCPHRKKKSLKVKRKWEDRAHLQHMGPSTLTLLNAVLSWGHKVLYFEILSWLDMRSTSMECCADPLSAVKKNSTHKNESAPETKLKTCNFHLQYIIPNATDTKSESLLSLLQRHLTASRFNSIYRNPRIGGTFCPWDPCENAVKHQLCLTYTKLKPPLFMLFVFVWFFRLTWKKR